MVQQVQQSHQLSILLEGLARMQHDFTQVLQFKSMEASQSLPEQALGRLVAKPSNLESFAGQLTSLNPAAEAHTKTTAGSTMSLAGGVDFDTCSCFARRTRQRNRTRWANLEIFGDTVVHHSHFPSCRYARVPGSTSRHHMFGVRLQSVLGIVNSAIEVTFTMSVGARFGLGGPNFAYHPIVDSNVAPAFQLFGFLFACCWKMKEARRTGVGQPLLLSEWSDLTASVSTKLLDLYDQNRASPMDVDGQNGSLVNKALDILAYTASWHEVILFFMFPINSANVTHYFMKS